MNVDAALYDSSLPAGTQLLLFKEYSLNLRE